MQVTLPGSVATNPPKGKRGCRGATAAELKNITALQCVKEFPDEPLCVSNRKLFCNACREEMSLEISNVRTIYQTQRGSQETEEQRCKGEIHSLTCFLCAGVPLRKYEHFR